MVSLTIGLMEINVPNEYYDALQELLWAHQDHEGYNELQDEETFYVRDLIAGEFGLSKHNVTVKLHQH